MKWRLNGCPLRPILHEYQYFTHLQRFTNRHLSVDLLFQGLTAPQSFLLTTYRFCVTVVVPFSVFFSRTIFLSRDSSLRAFRSPCDRLSFGLFNLILASSQISLLVERFLEQLRAGLVGPSLTWRGKDEVFIDPVKYAFKAPILLANWQKSSSSWLLIVFSLVTEAEMNFKPRDSKVICSSLSSVFDKFWYVACVTQCCFVFKDVRAKFF